MIKTSDFKRIFPACKDPEVFVEALNKLLPQYGINTPVRIAAFLAQTGHESGGYRAFRENLNYSAEALMRVFKKYFPNSSLATKYARKPEMIANRVYANRIGNGPESSGDGWKFRGRGLIQVTGRSNYAEFAKWRGITISEASALMETIDGAILSAIWFWVSRKIDAFADKGDIKGMTRVINGGYHGLEDRMRLYGLWKAVL